MLCPARGAGISRSLTSRTKASNAKSSRSRTRCLSGRWGALRQDVRSSRPRDGLGEVRLGNGSGKVLLCVVICVGVCGFC
jgi:hypothetical protein